MTASSPAPAVWFPTIATGTGTERFTERLAAGLARLGIRTEITWLPIRAEYAPWTVMTPRPPSWANVIHVNSVFPPSLLPANLPWVATIHSGMHDPRLAAFKSLFQRMYHERVLKPRERSLLHRAACVTAVSDYAGRTAAEVFGIAEPRTILNGVDTEVFTPRAGMRPEGCLRLLYVGRWSRRKGTDLIRPLLQRLVGQVEFLFTATPQEETSLRDLPGRVGCVGRLADEAGLAALYRRADVLIFPSRSEGFGLVAAEAMACGMPVVCSDDTALQEIVPHGECGLRCIPGDVASFAEAVRELATQEETLLRMSRAARTHAVEKLGETRMLEAYLAVYGQVLAQGGASTT
ncbi:MAG: hypothetical protein RL434_2667 [Pseudomonadota bacterium]|jgi:glycosyltransferase involved in cell wall biosynthesis